MFAGKKHNACPLPLRSGGGRKNVDKNRNVKAKKRASLPIEYVDVHYISEVHSGKKTHAHVQLKLDEAAVHAHIRERQGWLAILSIPLRNHRQM